MWSTHKASRPLRGRMSDQEQVVVRETGSRWSIEERPSWMDDDPGREVGEVLHFLAFQVWEHGVSHPDYEAEVIVIDAEGEVVETTDAQALVEDFEIEEQAREQWQRGTLSFKTGPPDGWT